MNVVVVDRHGKRRNGRILQVLGFHGLERREVTSAEAGDIVAITGVEGLGISDTLCDPAAVEALPALTVDEPTISMFFKVNDSPFAGRDGKFLTSRQIRERLVRETLHNVALRIEDTADPDTFKVSGRGELHLSILIETMRREGYEIAVSRPEVIVKEIDGQQMEPYEQLVLDLDENYQGGVIERLGERKAELRNLEPDGKGRVRLEYVVPARGLIGFQTEFRTITAGTGLMFHVFDHYGPKLAGSIGKRPNGVMISNGMGVAPAYSLFNLQERGRMLISANEEVYEGMLVGIHAKDNDLTVNPLKAKQLTNFRAAGKDDNLGLTPPVKLSLEQALEFIDDDELVEVTPKAVRLRKKLLTENDRKQASRKAG
jgi:GTP-binding protein